MEQVENLRLRSMSCLAPVQSRGTAGRISGANHLNVAQAVSNHPIPALLRRLWQQLAETVATGARWIHEMRFDGYRARMHLKDTAILFQHRFGTSPRKGNCSLQETARSKTHARSLGVAKMVNEWPEAACVQLQSRKGDGQVEAPWPGASRIEIEHPINGLDPRP